MLDCSAEIITHEETGEQCDPDKICNIVFERLEIKKRRGQKRYAVFFVIACILCGCVGGGLILGPGGTITNQAAFESETGLIEKEANKENRNSIESDFIDDPYLYDEQGNQIAKYVIEVGTNFEEDELYIDNGVMLILHNNGEGIENDENTEINLIIEQINVIGDPGAVEVGYIYNGRPYCIEVNNKYETAIKIKGEEGKAYYPYLKNISSDRVIINIKYKRERE